MSRLPTSLLDHLRTGATTMCRCWRVTRRDGRIFGFTDHDRGLSFDGTAFRPEDGLSARTLDQTTGLSVDNSEAIGVLSAAGVTEDDILSGRFDGAKVEHWLVNWQDVSERALLFRGEMGEIERAGGAFKAELRGLTEALNQPQGRVYQAQCPAILGDAVCRVDITSAEFSREGAVDAIDDSRIFDLGPLSDYPLHWFERGMLEVLDGPSEGDQRVIKHDMGSGSGRRIVVWEELRGTISAGDRVRIVAGCDKRFETCRAKFDNILNFRGFPHLPNEDFLMAYPVSGQVGTGEAGTSSDAG